jgi:hypothetical protein
LGGSFPKWETAIFRALSGVDLGREIGRRQRKMLGERAAGFGWLTELLSLSYSLFEFWPPFTLFKERLQERIKFLWFWI